MFGPSTILYKIRIFLTGSTGLLGQNLLKILLKNEKNEIFVLVRSLKNFSMFGNTSPRVNLILGDITKPNLGIHNKDILNLTNSINSIYHCAALTNFNADIVTLREVNFEGTKRVLNFAKACNALTTFHYVSSVFVSGKWNGIFSEDNFDFKQEFNNEYERSKFEAEQTIRESNNNSFRIAIYRPSAMINNLFDDFNNNNYHGLLRQIFRLIALQKFEALPIDLAALINIIPADVVANAICSLSNERGDKDVFHIVNSKNFYLYEVIEKGCKKEGYHIPKFVTTTQLTPVESKMLKPFLPYLFFKTSFNSEKTLNTLSKNGYRHPELPIDKVLEIILRK